MREAFPSLPFGSPALEKENNQRDTTIKSSFETFTTTANNISSNTIAASPYEILKDDLPRIIERDINKSSSIYQSSGQGEGNIFINTFILVCVFKQTAFRFVACYPIIMTLCI